MPLASQAQWRQVFALANRGELPMATAREMAEASAPYDSLPAYAGFKIPLNSIAGVSDIETAQWTREVLRDVKAARGHTDEVVTQLDYARGTLRDILADVTPGYKGARYTAAAGAGPDQCTPHWHHVNLPSGETIRTDYDCHVGAEAMTQDNARMQVDWGGKVPVTLDMRTKGDMVHGVATIHLPGVATPIRTTISLDWREIYNVLRNRGGAAAGGTEIGAVSPAGAYAAALATLGILAAIAGSKKPKVTQAYGAALTALALIAAYAGATAKRTAAGGAPPVPKGGAYAAAVAALGVLAALAGAKKNPGIARADRAWLAGLTALGLLAAYAATYMRRGGAAAGYAEALSMGDTLIAGDTLATVPLFYPGGEVKVGADLHVTAPDWQGAAFNVSAPDMNVEIHVGAEDEAGGYAKGAAMTALAAMVAAAGIRGRGAFSPGARALGDGRVGGSASDYQRNVAATALTAMAAFGVASLAGDDTETLIAGGESFDLLTKAKTIARSDVIKNLNRVVRKSLSNPLIRQAMQLDKQARAQFALKIGARVYGRAMNGDQAAKRAIKLLHEQYKKGSRFAARALRLMNLGRRQYYGAKISGDASTDNLELIGACVDMPASLERKIAAGADYDLELLLEAATGVGAWEGVDWIADRLKWQPMAGDPNQVGARGLLLAGRRAQIAAYTPGRL